MPEMQSITVNQVLMLMNTTLMSLYLSRASDDLISFNLLFDIDEAALGKPVS